MNTELLMIGLLCGAILGSSLILLGIYCHWHFTQNNERGKTKKNQKEESAKKRISRSQVSSKCQQCQSPAHASKSMLATSSGQEMSNSRDRRKESLFTEIDMMSNSIELVIHRNRSDGTLQRKKYNHSSGNKSRANHSYQYPADMENGPLLGDNQAALENHSATATAATSAVLPEFGYVVAQQNGKRASISYSTAGGASSTIPISTPQSAGKTSSRTSLVASKRTDVAPRLSFRSRDYQILVPEKPAGEIGIMRRYTSAPVTGTGTGSSPNYSTRSSGYESSSGAAISELRSPSPISPTRMRTLTRRITEIQAAQKRFKRFASLPNYRSGQNLNPTIPELSDSAAGSQEVKLVSNPSSGSSLCLGLVGRPLTGPDQNRSEISPRSATLSENLASNCTDKSPYRQK